MANMRLFYTPDRPSHEVDLSTATEIDFYRPEGVSDFLVLGRGSFVGAVDETTVLKFAKVQGDEEALAFLDLEARILRAIGPHRHVVGLKGQRDDGILLERSNYGSLACYLQDHMPSWEQRLSWMLQATEAVAATHAADMIHCDINVTNMLLDDDLTLKLCDFQGLLLRPDGTVAGDGLSRENTKSSMPQTDPGRVTDLFALGSAFYHIAQSHELFPDLDSYCHEEEIEERFKSHRFSKTQSPLLDDMIHKCWKGEYKSAQEISEDLGPVIEHGEGSIQ